LIKNGLESARGHLSRDYEAFLELELKDAKNGNSETHEEIRERRDESGMTLAQFYESEQCKTDYRFREFCKTGTYISENDRRDMCKNKK
jgi:hypothetical protein